VLLWRFLRTGGRAMLRMMNQPAEEVSAHGGHGDGGHGDGGHGDMPGHTGHAVE